MIFQYNLQKMKFNLAKILKENIFQMDFFANQLIIQGQKNILRFDVSFK